MKNSVVKEPADCWMWTKCSTSEGYGRIKVDGKVARTHRISYEIFIGEIPEGQLIRHKCDNPACWNPSHLELGNCKENTADIWLRGRSNSGYQKITAGIVVDIRNESFTGVSSDELAQKHELQKSYVDKIIRREVWNYAESELEYSNSVVDYNDVVPF